MCMYAVIARQVLLMPVHLAYSRRFSDYELLLIQKWWKKIELSSWRYGMTTLVIDHDVCAVDIKFSEE